MTVEEFSNQFDIHYNNIASNSAPPIDLYEKSVFLTKAQLEIVKNYFNPKGNKYQDGFEQSSKRRNDLKELIKNHKSTTIIPSTNNLSNDSKFFTIPDDTFLIIQESGRVSSDDKCIDGKYIDVVPKTHDEYNKQSKNPFKNPDKSVIWRMDYSEQGGDKNVELITPYTLDEYKFRYVQLPKPIILADLDTVFPGEGLTIQGDNTSQTCLLSESIHYEILDRAVDLATADYEKNDKVGIRTQMSSRNE